MMTFYAAVGCYRVKEENGRKVPYIQKLGKLNPISIPEFVIWSTLLWEVMDYEELKTAYEEQIKAYEKAVPSFDELLHFLLKRKLLMRGIGYTGVDALYNMLSDAFVIPYRISRWRKIWSASQMLQKGRISGEDLRAAFRRRSLSAEEQRVYNLIEQTPLNTAELIRCFDRNITDVSSSEKVIEGIYSDGEDTDQDHISNEQGLSENTNAVLLAVSNLYLGRQVILEIP